MASVVAVHPSVIGREAELALIDEFVPHGGRVRLLEGAAGIGKTTLWREGLAAARSRSYTVLQCRPAEPESGLGFGGLIDLFAPVADELALAAATPAHSARCRAPA